MDEARRARIALWLRGLGVASVLVLGCGDVPDDEVVLVGSVERTFVEIAAPVSEVLIELGVDREAQVEAGQVVGQLDTTLADADVASAEAAVASARSVLSMAEEEAERSRKLRRDKVISQQQLDRAVLALEEARARRREAEAREEAAAKRRADHTLRAPLAGVVDQLPFEAGERVPAGAVIAVISVEADPWVRVWLPEPVVTRVSRGAPARVQVDGLGVLEGRLVEIAREPEYTPHFALTERERAYLVFEGRVRITHAPAELRAGVPAEVTLPLVRPPAASAEAVPDS